MKIIGRKSIDIAVQALSRGDLVAFPTETVYGLGGNAYNSEAVSKIFLYKNRPQLNPINVCYPSFEKAMNDVEVTDLAMSFAEKFLPGAVTLILKKKSTSKISLLCYAERETLGIRIPNHPLALELLNALDFPLAAPSANRSSELSTTTPQSVYTSLKDCSNLIILNGGKCKLGIESTIIDLSTNKAIILRQGAVTIEEIKEKCNVIPVIANESYKKHYYPKKTIVMNAKSVNSNDALLAFGKPIKGAKYCLNLSYKANLLEAAQNFFSMLRKLDDTDANRICIMPIPDIGIGKALNNRLLSSQ